MASFKIDKTEVEIIVAMIAFAMLWIVIGIPYFTADPTFTSIAPPLQYILFNLGFIAFTVAIFGTGITLLQKKAYNIIAGIENGLITWLGFSFMLDMLQPPYAIDLKGNYVISTVGTGVMASVDYAWVWLFNALVPQLKGIELFGISGLVYAVYVVIPVMTLVIGAYILSNGQFAKWVGVKK